MEDAVPVDVAILAEQPRSMKAAHIVTHSTSQVSRVVVPKDRDDPTWP